MVEVSTSLLSVKKEDVIKTIYNLETAGTNYFHIDVMDGEFVKNNTTQQMNEYCQYLNTITNIPLDIHLMVKDVESHVKNYLIYNPNIITFHYEAIKDKEEIHKLINYIKENNCKVGIAIKPETNIEEIYDLLPYIHLLLVMTVEPGEGGQELIIKMLDKIEKVKKYINHNNIEIDIEVDGGINYKNSKDIKNAGADIIVSGSAIINSGDYKTEIEKIRSK